MKYFQPCFHEYAETPIENEEVRIARKLRRMRRDWHENRKAQERLLRLKRKWGLINRGQFLVGLVHYVD